MKVVGVMPAGRTRFMKILFPHLLQQEGIDEFEIWENTHNSEDIEFMCNFANEHSDRFSVQPLPCGGVEGSGSIRHFMRFCCDPDVLYVRIDDDICWMANDCLKNLVEFRMNNQEHFLVHANVINNNICSYLHQATGAMSRKSASLLYESSCGDAMANPELACEAHDCFRKHYEEHTLDEYEFKQWIDWQNTRICINLISWFGRDMYQDGRDFINKNEELEMSVRLPEVKQMTKAICGNALAVHYSYGTQLHGVPDEYLAWYESITPTV